MSSNELGVDRRLERLSPAQRALLEQRLMQRRTAVARRNAITRREIHTPCELSYAQELLWLLSQVFDDGIAYNSPGAFHLEGELDLELLRRAFYELIKRHEILRTTYTVIDGQPMQVIGPPFEVELNLADLRGRSHDEQETESQRVLKEEARFAFDLVNGPVLRPTVIQLSDREHILMLNMHHVCTDGYSRTAIYRDLTVLYEALAEGRPSPLPPLPIQYADYAVWQREWLGQGIADEQLGYWREQLRGAPSRLDLPTDFPRPPVRSYIGEQISVILDLSTREGLRTVGRAGDATLFVVMLALFAELLHRYSGQEDIVIGSPFAGRNRSELESMVGYFINPLALRLDLSGNPSFSELVSRAREVTLAAFAHADVPYETIVRAINPQRDLSQTPVFQAMIVLHNPAWQTQRPKFEPAGIRCAEITHEKGWAKFDVLLGMSERTTGLNTTWEYSTELFSRETVQRMMEHFGTLCESAAASPDSRLASLSMLSESERAWVLRTRSHGNGSRAAEGSLKELFERQAARRADETAVVFGDQRLTFGALNRHANKIAAMLEDRGVGPGVRVGVLLEKSIDLIPAVLGVVKSGAAYIPLDPNYPDDRLRFMLADAAPAVVISHQRHLADAPGDSAELVAIDAPGTLDSLSGDDPPTVAGPDDLAYVIYTSGSTGTPKGAMIANRSVLSAYHAWEEAYQLDELRSHLQMASFSFDVFTGDLIRSMGSGAKLVLCPLEVALDPAALYDLIVREEIDFAEFVPATAAILFDYVESELKPLEGIRLIAVASEAWRTERYEQYKRLLGPEARLVNSYGLTEATIDSTWYELAAGGQLTPGRFVPIGRPFANTRVYIVDSGFEPQPIGIPGELCVGGVAVGLGYLNRPDLTSERFVPDPFSDEPEARLYRTGDLARWLPDGNVEFLGRTDRQLKIRGFRIEPGEIEAVLERHPDIRAAAVIDRRDLRGEPRLVAYVHAGGASPRDSELRAFASEHVPGYMIPNVFVAVSELPYTPNGKVDRDALPDPEWDQATAREEFLAPRTDIERAVAGIWSAVLGTQEISIRDNFFALGGHSLIAMQVMSRVRDALGVVLSLRAIFDAPTVMELAAAVDAARDADGSAPAAPALVRVQRTPPVAAREAR